MNVHCPDCDHTFLLTPDGMTQAAACPNCGGARLERDQPSPVNSDGDLRNTPHGSDPALQDDPGGNPNQSGIWGQIDGGWKPWRKRDESFASVKNAGGYRLPGEDFVEDNDPGGYARRMKIRRQLKDNDHPREHQLNWTPGNHGRGLFVGPYLHSWNAYHPDEIDLDNPNYGTMHGEYIQGLGLRDPDLIDASTGVEIRPDGTVESLSGRDPSDYVRVDPRLRAGERGWTFGSLSKEARSLNMEPYIPWTHLAEVVEDTSVAPQHTAVVTPGHGGVHNGPLYWLGFLDAHINGKPVRENQMEIFNHHARHDSPSFGQPVEVAVHHPEHLPAAISVIEDTTVNPGKTTPELTDLAKRIHSGEIPPPNGINPEHLKFANVRVAFWQALLPIAGRLLAGAAGRGLMSQALGFGGGGPQEQNPQLPPGPESIPPRSIEQLAYVTSDYETPHTNPRFVESEDGDTHQFDDESTDPALHNPNIPGGAGGAAQGEDNVGAGIGSDKPGFSSHAVESICKLLPKILEFAEKEESGLDDPELKELHEQLEKEHPGYLDEDIDEDAVEELLSKIREGSTVTSRVSFGIDQGFAPNQGRCAYCGGVVNAGGDCPQCGARNNPHQLNPQNTGHGPGYNPALAPQTQAQPYVGKTSADHQGPVTDEQKKAVAELLLENGRADEIPHMLEAPWDFAKELAAITNQQNVAPNVDPNEQPPPMPAQEIAPPGATMPVPNPADPSQGGQMISRVSADDPNPIGVPAADQIAQRDISQEQDSSHTWKTDDNQPLQVGQVYQIHSPNYGIPDIVKVIAIKPDSLVVETVGEYSAGGDDRGELHYQYEISHQEAELEGLSFTPDEGDLEESPEHLQEDADGPLEPNTEEQEIPNIPQPLSNVQDDRCPRCSNTHVSSEMSSPTTTFHECYKCGHSWEQKEEDYEDSNTASREWLNESGLEDFEDIKVDKQQSSRDLSTAAARTAGKNFTPSEQRAFIDEQGVARNADKLDLDGTHYESHRYLGDRANSANVPDEHMFLGI